MIIRRALTSRELSRIAAHPAAMNRLRLSHQSSMSALPSAGAGASASRPVTPIGRTFASSPALIGASIPTTTMPRPKPLAPTLVGGPLPGSRPSTMFQAPISFETVSAAAAAATSSPSSSSSSHYPSFPQPATSAAAAASSSSHPSFLSMTAIANLASDNSISVVAMKKLMPSFLQHHQAALVFNGDNMQLLTKAMCQMCDEDVEHGKVLLAVARLNYDAHKSDLMQSRLNYIVKQCAKFAEKKVEAAWLRSAYSGADEKKQHESVSETSD